MVGGRDRGVAAPADDRADEDDPSRAPLDHVRDRRLAAPPRAREIGIDDAPPVLVVELPVATARRVDAGAADEDVDPPEFLDRRGGHAARRLGIEDVDSNRGGAMTLAPQRLGERGRFGRPDIGQHHGGAARGEEPADAAADAARGAGHDDDLPVKAVGALRIGRLGRSVACHRIAPHDVHDDFT